MVDMRSGCRGPIQALLESNGSPLPGLRESRLALSEPGVLRCDICLLLSVLQALQAL